MYTYIYIYTKINIDCLVVSENKVAVSEDSTIRHMNLLSTIYSSTGLVYSPRKLTVSSRRNTWYIYIAAPSWRHIYMLPRPVDKTYIYRLVTSSGKICLPTHRVVEIENQRPLPSGYVPRTVFNGLQLNKSKHFVQSRLDSFSCALPACRGLHYVSVIPTSAPRLHAVFSHRQGFS